MTDLDLALATIGGAGLLDEDERAWREREPSHAPAPRPGVESTTKPIPRTFDAVFAAYGQGIPVAYLRALAWHESRLDPRAKTRASSATGLLQIINVVRSDHNRLHGTAYTRADLTDPIINVTIATSALRRIVRSYARNHPAIANLLEDWNNYRFTELLTQGWNGGWSERAGVGRVARYLVEHVGATNITAALVHQHARAAGATRYLAEPARLAWAEKVARHYAAERADDADPLVARNAGHAKPDLAAQRLRIRRAQADVATQRLRIQRLMGDETKGGVRWDLAFARRAKANGRTVGWDGDETIDEAIAKHEARLAMWQAKLDALDQAETDGSPSEGG